MYKPNRRGVGPVTTCIAAGLAFVCGAALADDTTITTTTTTETTSFAPIPTILPPPPGPNGQPIDFTVLIDSPFNYQDLRLARKCGFSDSDVARIAKISYESGVPFDDVMHQALAGQTFTELAYRYNLRLYDVWDVSDYEAKIAEYKCAYEHTGLRDVNSLVAAYQEELYTNPYGTTVIANIPEGTDNLASIIRHSPDLTLFERALRRTRMDRVLRGSGQYTVFAPTDSAWSKLSTDQVNNLFADRDALTKIVNYCIVPRHFDSAAGFAMAQGAMIGTNEGDQLSITSSGSTLMVNGATVIRPDTYATNGVLQEVDAVLIPPTVTTVNGTAWTGVTSTSPSTTLAPSTTIAPSSTTSVAPNGAATTVTPNGTTTVEPNGTTTISPNGPGSTTVSPAPNGSTTVTPSTGQ